GSRSPAPILRAPRTRARAGVASGTFNKKALSPSGRKVLFRGATRVRPDGLTRSGTGAMADTLPLLTVGVPAEPTDAAPSTYTRAARSVCGLRAHSARPLRAGRPTIP